MFKITCDIVGEVRAFAERSGVDKLFLLTDDIVRKSCLPVSGLHKIDIVEMSIPSGEQFKNIEQVQRIWNFLIEYGATRSSLFINFGGGVVSDLGGFAASTFKRGIRFINIPTTVLAAVDASFGGKTGIDYCGLKNEIGCFSDAEAVFVNPVFFSSLDSANRLSGYAEMVKHALLSDRDMFNRTLALDQDVFSIERLTPLLAQNIDVKQRFTALDPLECGMRKALNLGHTFGHAFESLSYSIDRPMLHGFAVMWGLVAALYLSVIKLDFDKDILLKLHTFAKENYGVFPYTCKQYDMIIDMMTHDKKNCHDTINFTLLSDIGIPIINQTATQKEILSALDFLREN